ncbi:MAG: hypothetical protein WBM44_21440 [Waterburya sp.]
MNNFFKWRSFVVKVSWTCLLIGIIYLSSQANQSVLAQSNRNFSSEIASLRARMNQLEQNVNRIRNGNIRLGNPQKSQPAPILPQQRFRGSNPPLVDGQVIGQSDPTFKRMATLLIELKEDVRGIEERLTKIEQTTNP